MTRKFNLNQFKNLTRIGKITVPYGGATRYESFHPGIDVANIKGTQIKSPVSGVVKNVVNGKKQGDNGFGNYATIKSANGDEHKLSHLNIAYVKKGDITQAGKTSIGELGNSGASYSPSGRGDGSHLDYRIISAYRKYKNPYMYLKNL